jgi:hypothetical protein
MVDYLDILQSMLEQYANDIGITENIKVVSERAILQNYDVSNDDDNYFLDETSDRFSDLYDEQGNVKFNSNTIYIILKMLPGQIFLNSVETPVIIYAISEDITFDKAKLLLSIFAESQHLKDCYVMWKEIDENANPRIKTEIRKAKQEWNTPTIGNNFLPIGPSIRSLITVTGKLSVLDDMNDVKSLKYFVFDNNGDFANVNDVEFYQGVVHYQASLDTEPLEKNKNSESIAQFGHGTLQLVLPFKKEKYDSEDNFMFRILKIISIEKPYEFSSINGELFINEVEDEDEKMNFWEDNGETNELIKPFYFKIELETGFVIRWKMKFSSFDLTTEKGGLPALSLVFSH